MMINLEKTNCSLKSWKIVVILSLIKELHFCLYIMVIRKKKCVAESITEKSLCDYWKLPKIREVLTKNDFQNLASLSVTGSKLIFLNLYYTCVNTLLVRQKIAKFTIFCDQLLKKELSLQMIFYKCQTFINMLIFHQKSAKFVINCWKLGKSAKSTTIINN